MGRLINVFAAPGEVFEEIKPAPHQVGNWLVPLLLSCLVAVGYVLIVFSQPAILQQMRDQQDQAIDKQVAAGKMPKETADRTKEFFDRYGATMTKVGGAVGAVVMGAVMLFLMGLGLWLAGAKALRGGFGFMKAVELAGLGSMIALLDTVVRAFLAVLKGNMLATPGPALLLGEIDPANKLHLALSALTVFEVWYVVVLAIGLSKLSGASFARAAGWAVVVRLAVMALFMAPAFIFSGAR